MGNFLRMTNGVPRSAAESAASGGNNLISTNDSIFENNSVNDWTRYQNTTQFEPVDGTGGSPSSNLTFTTTATNPLNGTYSALLTKSGSANMQGYGVSLSSIAVPLELRGQNLSLDFYYTVASGTYTSSDLIVRLYDQTNGALISADQESILLTNTGVAGRFRANFTCPVLCANVRVIIHQASVTTNNYTISFDDFTLWPVGNPVSSTSAASVTDWQAYTPVTTGFGTLGTTDVKWRRVGSSIEVKGRFLTGTQQAAVPTISLPNGYTISSSELESPSRYYFGTFVIGDPGLQQIYSGGTTAGILTNNGTDPSTLVFSWRTQSNAFVLDNENTFLGTGYLVSFEFSFIAAGLSSSFPVPNNTGPNYVYSGSSGAFNTSSASYVDVTNMSVTITTNGGPVFIGVTPDGNTTVGQESWIRIGSTSNTAQALFQFVRSGTVVGQSNFEVSDSGLTDNYDIIPASSLSCWDTPPAGTYTYKLQTHKGSGSSANVDVYYSRLFLFELPINGASGVNTSSVSEWTKVLAPAITSTGSSPTKGTTQKDFYEWRRVGGDLQVRYSFIQTGTGSAGSGQYLFNLIPTGLQIDLTQGISVGDGWESGWGGGYVQGTNVTGTAVVSVHDATTVRVNVLGSTLGNGTNGLNNANQEVSIFFSVPIVGWTATFASGSGSVSSISKTSTYTLSDYDGILFVDTTAPWTLTVPTASSNNKNKIFRIKKTSSDFNTLTISGGLTDRLDTIGECIEIINDGTTWSVVNRTGLTALVSTNAVVITANISNPTKGTIVNDVATWYRDGSRLKCLYSYYQSAGGSNGSGEYFFSAVPSGSGLNVDTTYIVPGYSNNDWTLGVAGAAYVIGSQIGQYNRAIVSYAEGGGQKGMQLTVDGATAVDAGGSFSLGKSGLTQYSAEWSIPIVGWKDR